MKKVFLRLTILLICFGVGVSAFSLLRPRASKPLSSFVNETVDVQFTKDCEVLWLGKYEYDNLVLLAAGGDRVIFLDKSGEFDKNASDLDGVDRFGYGAESLAKRPMLLGEHKFSVITSDIESVSKDGEIIYRRIP